MPEPDFTTEPVPPIAPLNTPENAWSNSSDPLFAIEPWRLDVVPASVPAAITVPPEEDEEPASGSLPAPVLTNLPAPLLTSVPVPLILAAKVPLAACVNINCALLTMFPPIFAVGVDSVPPLM